MSAARDRPSGSRRVRSERQRFADDVAERTAREVRAIGLFEVPGQPYLSPPHDLDAERSVVAAIIDGSAHPAELECEAGDFYLEAHQLIVAAAETLHEAGFRLSPDDVSLRRLLVILVEWGAPEVRTGEVLRELTLEVPFTVRWRSKSRRIARLAHHRRVLEDLRQLDDALRLETSVDPASLRRLRMELASMARETETTEVELCGR